MKTEADLLTFLGRTGVFFGPNESGCWTVGDFFRCKEAILRLLRTKPEKWRLRMFPYEPVVEMLAVRSKPRVEFAWTGGQHPEHAVVLSVETTVEALLCTVFVDHLSGADFGFCEYCGKWFKRRASMERSTATMTVVAL
jgi:hypothetical protein